MTKTKTNKSTQAINIIDAATREGREHARVYHAVHGRLAIPGAVYSRDEPNYTTTQIFECAAQSDFTDLGLGRSGEVLRSLYVGTRLIAAWDWRP